MIVKKLSNTLRHKFSHNLINSIFHSVIYYIPCQSSYIGETTELNRKIYQNNYEKRNCNTNNVKVKHCIENKHAININIIITIHKEIKRC